MNDLRSQLIEELKRRIVLDNKYAWRHLRLAVLFNAVAVLGSIGAAVTAAGGWLYPSVVSFLAALPSVVILILQRYSFYSRSRWHCMVETQVSGLVRTLIYEGADPAEVSKKFSALMTYMEQIYPGRGLEGIERGRSDHPKRTKLPSPQLD